MSGDNPLHRRSTRKSNPTSFFVPHIDTSSVKVTGGNKGEIVRPTTTSDHITDRESPSTSTSLKESVSSVSEPGIQSVDRSNSETHSENKENLPRVVQAAGTSSSNQKAKSRKRPAQASNNVPATKTTKKRKTKYENIMDKLKSIGDKPEEGVGNCARAAIYKGSIKMKWDKSDFDQIIISDKLECGHVVEVTLRDLLEQPDYGGSDYCDLQECTVFCKEFECWGRTYVTRVCSGSSEAEFDCGKYHNHCNKCKNFGKCIGDYRESHCDSCGKHFFEGSMGTFKCPRCDTGCGSSSDSEREFGLKSAFW